jgi:hypothetical protein
MPVGVGHLCTLEAKPRYILLLHSVYSTVHLIKSQSSSPYFSLQETKEQKLEAYYRFAGSIF